MSDLLTFFDFVMDIVCMMPPIDEVEAIQLTRTHAILFAMGSIGLLVFAIIVTAMKDALAGSTVTTVVISLCVLGIGFIGLRRTEPDMIKGIFLTAYPPMVIALRCGEGAILGGKASHYLRWWYLILITGILAGAYFGLKQIPPEALAYIKGGWAILGAGVASLIWSTTMAKSPLFKNPFCTIGIIFVFASTLIYVSVSAFEQSLFKWALPAGVFFGIISAQFSQREENSMNNDTSE